MPWDVILLPLLGGFWFVWIFYRTRFRAVQASRQVLIFFSASAAVTLLVVARVIVLVLKEGPWGLSFAPGIIADLRASLFPWPYTGTAVFAFILGPISATFLNIFHDRAVSNRHAIRRMGDPLERALLSAREADGLMVFYLKSGKVYVGLVVEIPANLDGRCPWLSIVPYYSGYRDSKTQDLDIQTDYSQILKQFALSDSESTAKYERIIRVDDIELCGRFDEDIWLQFHGNNALSVSNGSE